MLCLSHPAASSRDRWGKKHPDSESDDDARQCQADCVAWKGKGGLPEPLSRQPCRDQARAALVPLLEADVAHSAGKELAEVDGTRGAQLCSYHTMQYQAKRHTAR